MTKKKSRRNTYMAALSAAAVAGSIVAAAPASAAVSFSDVTPTTPHASSILNLAERGIVSGFPGGEFRPKEELNRAQAAKMLALSLGLNVDNVKDPGFTDVKSDKWYYKYVAALKAEGVVDGFTDGSFRPDANLKRSEIAKFLVEGYDLKGSYATENPFVDVKADTWYEKYVLPLYATKITTGKSATVYAPDRFVTRGEFSTFVVRAENYNAKSDDLIADAKAKIRQLVELNEEYTVDGEVVGEASYDHASNTLTLTSYDPNGLEQIESTGFFSDQLPSLGVYEIKIGNNDPVDVSTDFAAAKETIKSQIQATLKPSADAEADGDISAENVQITLFAEKDGTKFWEDFNLNLHVFLQ